MTSTNARFERCDLQSGVRTLHGVRASRYSAIQNESQEDDVRICNDATAFVNVFFDFGTAGPKNPLQKTETTPTTYHALIVSNL